MQDRVTAAVKQNDVNEVRNLISFIDPATDPQCSQAIRRALELGYFECANVLLSEHYNPANPDSNPSCKKVWAKIVDRSHLFTLIQKSDLLLHLQYD